MHSDWLSFEERFPLVMEPLKNARRSGRLAHAFLLCSSNAPYRLDFPVMLQALAACETPEQDGSPCGKCGTCREIFGGTYPDCYTIAPSSLSRIIPVGEDENEVDSMRWFESLFHLTSMTKSGWRFGVVQEADRMNEFAQNAFLKTLEEPPAKCMFILATARPSELLPTIRSRCQALMLTDNACRYSFTGMKDVIPVLDKLAFSSENSLLAAEECAEALSAAAGTLSDEAKKTVAEKWKPRLELSENLESAGKTLLEKRIKGEEGCEYRRMREEFVSLIHAFFAQISLLAEKAPFDSLPNPELVAPPFDIDKASAADPEKARRMLSYAEDLLRAMRTNANDELAIRTFCLKAAFK